MSDKNLSYAVLDATRWWFVRHAPVVDASPAGRISAQLDVDAAIEASNPAYGWLAQTLPFDGHWMATNLKRTTQTLEAIVAASADARQKPVYVTEPELAEQSFGDWAGMTWEQLAAMEGDEVEKFWQAPATTRPPGGESFGDVCQRVARAVERISLEQRGRDIICVAHAGTVRAALAMALDISPDQALSLAVANLSLTRIDLIESGIKLKRGGSWRVGGVNWICA